MDDVVIEVKNLKKTYKTYKRGVGFKEAIKSLFKRNAVYSDALKGINFQIKKGEIVGFVGPNGAGKSTAIKIMTSILHPSSGEAKVLGFVPYQKRKKYVAHIGAVFGQKSQIWWDLPSVDSFYLNKGIYNIPTKDFEERLSELSKLLKIEEIMLRPARNLSLGERMKCELVMALLHNPQVLFLDEPTIGVDALSKEEIREFLQKINQKFKTTIILTTHDMDDIEELCQRLIIIDKGIIIYDGSLDNIKNYLKCKTVDFEIAKVTNKKEFDLLIKKGEMLANTKWFKSVQFNKDKVNVPDAISKLMKCADIIDLTIRDPKLEHIIKEIYTTGNVDNK